MRLVGRPGLRLAMLVLAACMLLAAAALLVLPMRAATLPSAGSGRLPFIPAEAGQLPAPLADVPGVPGVAAGLAGAATRLELLPEDIAFAQSRTLQRLLEVTGSLRALDQAAVKAKVGGELREVRVREGESVRAGQILAFIDATEAGLRARQAEENVAAAVAQLEIARKHRDNSTSLARRGFISHTAEQNAESQHTSARANVDVQEAALAIARKQVEDAVVRAPIAGSVATRLVQPGEKVAVDSRLFDIVDLGKLEFEAAVPAAEIVHVRVGQDLAIRPEGVDQALQGRIVRINPINHGGSRSYMIYAALRNADRRLRPGLFAQASITVEVRQHAISVPQTAVRARGGQNIVYIVEGGRIALRTVTTGLTSDAGGGVVEILSGLAPGTPVIRVNLGGLVAGSQVRIAGSSPGSLPASASAPPRDSSRPPASAPAATR